MSTGALAIKNGASAAREDFSDRAVAMKTGWLSHELYVRRDAGFSAGVLPPGLTVQPGTPYENAESKRRFRVLVEVSGLAFRALRDNVGYAISRGISPFKYQLWVFALSAFFTGLAGADYAVQFKVVGPTAFSFTLLLFLLSMIFVGGIGSLWRPLSGAAVLMLADEGFKELQDWRALGMGSSLPLLVVLLPSGLVGLFKRKQTTRPSVGQGHAAEW
jgi:hypothetical protein